MSTLSATFYDASQIARLDGTLTTRNPIVAGALPTVALSSGTAAQVSATRNATAAILYTLDATNNVATVKIELSPDNSTFTSLGTISFAAAVNNTGAIALIATVPLPPAWPIHIPPVPP